MRTATMNLQEGRQRMAENISARRVEGDRLVESLVNRGGIGEGLKEAYGRDADRVRNLAFAIKHTEDHFRKLTESQISSAFSTTPENVMRVLRLGYLNTCRQDAFWETGLQTARDVFYSLEPAYAKTLRGATAGKVMYEDSSFRSVGESTVAVFAETPNATIKTFTIASIADAPIRPNTVLIDIGNAVSARDDGKGNIVGTDLAGGAITGTINYADGATSITFATAPAVGAALALEASISLEADDDLSVTQAVELKLRAIPFTLREYPIYGSFSKMTDLLLGTTVEVDAEEAYLRSMADELRKSLDFQAFRLGYRQALKNAGTAGPVVFNMTGAVGESETDRVQAISRYIGKAGNKMYSDLLRGGVSKIYGGPSAVDVLTMHDKWSDTGAMSANGIHKLGMLGNIDVFKTPTQIVPDNQLVCVYKNPDAPEDVFMAIGTLVPMHVTDKIELPNRNTEFGVASYGDIQIVNQRYAQLIQIDNL